MMDGPRRMVQRFSYSRVAKNNKWIALPVLTMLGMFLLSLPPRLIPCISFVCFCSHFSSSSMFSLLISFLCAPSSCPVFVLFVLVICKLF